MKRIKCQSREGLLAATEVRRLDWRLNRSSAGPEADHGCRRTRKARVVYKASREEAEKIDNVRCDSHI
ncbi:hypothetical protein F2P81_001116 [Scophthalmus maximus]|uniref:Uncharacterized protein n=1 Tax=Scophthalmus maximus TaxID=52904 RepID=A0A6A4TMT6_SCOMX|nr:hypothetical protein F2P81_001116 [Scophthalmus maximus]